jgi:ribosomal protein S25
VNPSVNSLTVAEICQRNDLSMARAEMALANLQEKGLVSGYVPGDVHAQITLTDDAAKYIAC